MNNETMRERFNELKFASRHTEEQEPFFWKWTEHGNNILLAFIEAECEKAKEDAKFDLENLQYQTGLAKGTSDERERVLNILTEEIILAQKGETGDITSRLTSAWNRVCGSWELSYCKNCAQMTNHRGVICLKCHLSEQTK